MTMTKKKKGLIAALSVTLVAVIAAGTTLAYLFNKTEEAVNVFTFADNVRAELDEPSWDPEEGLDLVPGAQMDKDPQITNTSKNAVDEYAAIKITFQKGDGTTLTDAEAEKLMGLITIDWSQNWTQITGTTASAERIFRFDEILNPGVTSDPLFYSVGIDMDITSDDQLWLAGNYGHTDECYVLGTHDPAVCTITYRHHEKCAIYGEDGAKNVAQGGSLNGKTCNCTPSEIHNAECPALIGRIPVDETGVPTCGHTTLQDGLGGFNIKIQGAVVQADAFADVTEADSALISLFNTPSGE